MTRPATVTTLTDDDLARRWAALLDAHPWLDGLTCNQHCANVFCCPPEAIPDWAALSEAAGLLFLAGGTTSIRTLTRDLVPALATGG